MVVYVECMDSSSFNNDIDYESDPRVKSEAVMVTMESPSMWRSPSFVYRAVQVLVVVLALLLISPVESYRENGVEKETGAILNKKMDAGDQFRVVPGPKVSVSTVAWLTLAMAVATGLGAVPFFFVQLEPRWGGICNGVANGVMLAASFDLIQEGQRYGGGSWVVIGTLSGGLFILLSQQVVHQNFGEVSMLDVNGVDVPKMILVGSIMTLHSFGEGSGVGVSFAGPRGYLRVSWSPSPLRSITFRRGWR